MELPHGKRADLACRAARDIAEIVRLLSLQPNDKPRPAVLGRVHALACAIDSLMSDDMDGVSDIHARLYPHDGGQAHA